jgi:penicillin-binding protein 2
MKRQDDIPFEDSLHDDWSRDLNMVEVPIGNRPLRLVAIAALAVVLAVFGKVAYLSIFNGTYYAARAADNASQSSAVPAPRGIVYDREGDALVANKAVFTATLNARVFISQPSLQTSTIDDVTRVLGLSSSTIWTEITASEAQDFATPIVLSSDLTQAQLVNLQALALPTVTIGSNFTRTYPQGQVFSSVMGYVGQPTAADLKADPSLGPNTLVGRAGIEEYYDSTLQGKPGMNVQFRNAQGKVLGTQEQSPPTIGNSLTLTIDGGLQAALYQDITNELAVLHRQIGLGLAIDPQNGQVLALVNVPGYDNNLFSDPASNTAAIQGLLTSPLEPMFNRIVAGQYNPGSTIKPLDGVAALRDGVITPSRELYSPGYLMVPNQYDPSHPTKYLDWEPHGYIDLANALAQSSDVYFYIVGGGSPATTTPLLNNPVDYGINGLGIDRLHTWWQTFGLGKPTGIDLPGEASGFLPTPSWWKKVSGQNWLTGDTYNVAIGQGNLLLTPLQLLSYVGAIANGGTIWRPYLNMSSTPYVDENLTSLSSDIAAVQQGMADGVTTPRGTAHILNDLPFSVCAKTGSAQIKNNTEENALFVGYAPCQNPQIALLILIQNSNQLAGLNAVPVAKQVLDWYYVHRMSAQGNAASTSAATTTVSGG